MTRAKRKRTEPPGVEVVAPAVEPLSLAAAEARQRRVQDLELAGERVGRTWDEEARWLLAFAERDLGRLSTGERLMLGDEILAFGGRLLLVPGIGKGIAAGGLDSFVDPLPDAMLQALHRELRAGVDALKKHESWITPLRGEHVILRWSGEGKHASVVRSDDVYNVEGAVLGRVVDVLTHSARLRQCPECRGLFVARRRQERHPACAQRRRDKTRREKVRQQQEGD